MDSCCALVYTGSCLRGKDPRRMNCPTCNGPGGVLLLTSVAPCERCQISFDKTNFSTGVAPGTTQFQHLIPEQEAAYKDQWEATPGFIRWEVLAKQKRLDGEYWPEVEAAVFRGELDINVPVGALFGAWNPRKRFILSKCSDYFCLKTGSGVLGRVWPKEYMYRYYW